MSQPLRMLVDFDNPFADRQRLLAANIHPQTGLATDYLNRFNEAVMLLELIRDDPAAAGDIAAWEPASYIDHFRRSGFKDRDLAVAAYAMAPASLRVRLDELSETMTTIVVTVREALALAPPPTIVAALAEEALDRLHPLLAEASGVIHGVDAEAAGSGDGDPQHTVDALFADRRQP